MGYDNADVVGFTDLDEWKNQWLTGGKEPWPEDYSKYECMIITDPKGPKLQNWRTETERGHRYNNMSIREMSLTDLQPIGSVPDGVILPYAPVLGGSMWILDIAVNPRAPLSGMHKMVHNKDMQPGEWYLLPSYPYPVHSFPIEYTPYKERYLKTSGVMALYHNGRREGIYIHGMNWDFVSKRLQVLDGEGQLRGGLVFLVERDTGFLLATNDMTGIKNTMLDPDDHAYYAENTPNDRINFIAKHVSGRGSEGGPWNNVGETRTFVHYNGDKEYILVFTQNLYGIDICGIYSVTEKVMFENMDSAGQTTSTVTISLELLIFIMAGIFGLVRFLKLRSEERERDRNGCMKRMGPVLATENILYPMCVASLSNLKEMVRFETHEEALRKNIIIPLFTTEEVLGFLRSRCSIIIHVICEYNGDSDSRHAAVVAAANNLCNHLSIAEEDVYLFIADISLPSPTTSMATRQLAMDSMASYAGLCKYLCIVTHPDGVPNTKKGFCLLQELAHLTTNKDNAVYTFWNEKLRDVTYTVSDMQSKWNVMEATPEIDDKVMHFGTMCRLYAMAITTGDDKLEPFLRKNKSTIFPEAVFGTCIQFYDRDPMPIFAPTHGHTTSLVV